jgi:16S rRNA (cytosine967-C5)-methyltransferase
MTARELAITVLYKIEVGEAYSNTALDKELDKSDLNQADKGLASELVYGVLTWKITLDAIIKRYSSIKLKKISPWIINILRIAIYQIAFLDKIPESAAVNESVKLAKRYGHIASSGFTNAILRKIEKNELEKLEKYLLEKSFPEAEVISIMKSHPLWIVEKLFKQYNKKFVIDLLDANNKTPDITLRVNTLMISRDELLKLLELKGSECTAGKLPDSIHVRKFNDFSSSFYSIQDEAAQLASIKLSPKENDVVLDMCSAPGGKTTHIAGLMNNKGKIDAWDIHEHRVSLVQEMSRKLGITIIDAIIKDATEDYPELYGKYDKILADVPCSGIGVIRKKPDIKWTRKESDIAELVGVQEKILDNAANYLKNGGTLVYSTCTVLKEENEEQIKKFLVKHKDFELVEETHLYPHKDFTDGFYIAVLRRLGT